MSRAATSYGLIFLKHGRLVGLLCLLSLTLGLTFYVYTRAVYQARSQLQVSMMDLPINADSATTQTSFLRLQREFFLNFRAPHLIERTGKRLGLVESTGAYKTIMSDFLAGVNVELLDQSTVMINVEAFSLDLASIWGAAMIEEYQAYQSEQRMRYRTQAVATYMRELEGVKQKVDESLTAKADFERSSRFTETSMEQMKLTQGVRDLYVVERKLEAAERAREGIEGVKGIPADTLAVISRYRVESDVKDVPTLLTSPGRTAPVKIGAGPPAETVVVVPGADTRPQVWEDLRSQRNQLADKRTEQARTFGPESEQIRDIDQKITLLDKQIESEMVAALEAFQDEYEQLQSRKTALRDSMDEYREVSETVAKNLKEYELLEQGSIAWDTAYKQLKTKIEALDFGGTKERVELEYIGLDRLREEPISPNKMKLLMSSLALSLALGLGIPIMIERFNSTAATIEDIEQSLNLPGLGIVPVTRKHELENIVRSPEIDSKIPNSLLENFRVIRSGIIMQGREGQESDVIMVTSARPAEGKTVNACNLGWAFASLNEPTLLIDSDLRRGRVHNVLEVPNHVGLTSVLSGLSTMEAAIQKTRVPGLWVLTRGPIVAGTTEKLCIPDYEQEIGELRLRFKRIIMDTPPVLGLSETASLMRLVDGVMLVVRAERTSHRDLTSAVKLLRKSGARFYGFVLNRLDLTRVSNYHNYYYYSSHYYQDMIDESGTAAGPIPAPQSPSKSRG